MRKSQNPVGTKRKNQLAITAFAQRCWGGEKRPIKAQKGKKKRTRHTRTT